MFVQFGSAFGPAERNLLCISMNFSIIISSVIKYQLWIFGIKRKFLVIIIKEVTSIFTRKSYANKISAPQRNEIWALVTWWYDTWAMKKLVRPLKCFSILLMNPAAPGNRNVRTDRQQPRRGVHTSNLILTQVYYIVCSLLKVVQKREVTDDTEQCIRCRPREVFHHPPTHLRFRKGPTLRLSLSLGAFLTFWCSQWSILYYLLVRCGALTFVLEVFFS